MKLHTETKRYGTIFSAIARSPTAIDKKMSQRRTFKNVAAVPFQQQPHIAAPPPPAHPPLPLPHHTPPLLTPPLFHFIPLSTPSMYSTIQYMSS